MSWITITLVIIFILYDLIALSTIYKSYDLLKFFYRENTGKNCSVAEKMFFVGMAIIVGVLWLPLAILSWLYSKL